MSEKDKGTTLLVFLGDWLLKLPIYPYPFKLLLLSLVSRYNRVNSMIKFLIVIGKTLAVQKWIDGNEDFETLTLILATTHCDQLKFFF